MNWFKVVKEKSLNLYDAYSKEFKEFEQSLKSDIDTVIDQRGSQGYQKVQDVEMNSQATEQVKNFEILKSIFDNQLIINDQMEFSEYKIRRFLQQIKEDKKSIDKDPNQLVMLNREDFTNYQVFYELHKDMEEVKKRYRQFDENFDKQFQDSDDSTQADKSIFRILYLIIYKFHEEKIDVIDKSDQDQQLEYQKEINQEQNDLNEIMEFYDENCNEPKDSNNQDEINENLITFL